MQIKKYTAPILCIHYKLSVYAVFLLQSFIASASGNVVRNELNIDFERLRAQEGINVARANKLLSSLYDVRRERYPKFIQDVDVFLDVGMQAGYTIKPGVQMGDNPEYDALLAYRRVWAYDSGIALTLAVATEDPSVHARARWLLKYGEFVENPADPNEQIFAGWPFSINQKHLGDSWRDVRYVTGANSFALTGICHYITSDAFKQLRKTEQRAYLNFFQKALEGMLYHVESDGPNEGLVAAGWTLNILRDIHQTDYVYYDLLDRLGYGWPEKIDGYSDPIRIVRAKNVVLEHCIGMLRLLNYTLDHFDQLVGTASSYTYFELNEVRKKLRDSVFAKLYNKEERHFITGRNAAGVSSSYKAIDNTSWLVLALRLEELTADQTDMLMASLVYTVENFTNQFTENEREYFGAYYFENGFEDPYIEQSFIHSEALHIEATCGLICSLLKFVRQYPNSPHDTLFRETTLRLWKSMQYWVHNNGFKYASLDLKDLYVNLESSTSATWYLFAYFYFNKRTLIVYMY